MQKTGISSKVLQKRIPTIVGISVLVLGLIAGTFLFSQGTGVFAPRANPQTTPKNIRVSNVTDTTFTVSFLTDAQTKGFVKYGSEPGDLDSEALDDRVQLSADNSLSFTLHHITVRGLEASATYHYVLGAGGTEYDQEGTPFTVKTSQKGGVPPAAKTINGVVLNENSSPAVNSVVYITLPNSGEMSALIRNQSGNWAIPLSDARTADGSAYATINEADPLSIFAQGPTPSQTAQFTTTVAQAQPVATITFGQTPSEATRTTAGTSEASLVFTSPSPSPETLMIDPDNSQTSTGGRGGLLDDMDMTAATDDNDSEDEGANQQDTSRQIAQALITPSPIASIRPTPSPTPFGTNNPFPIPSVSPTVSPSATPRVSPTATPSATPRATASASTSSLPVSGSVDTTLVLILGGIFFIIAGSWSFWVGNTLSKNDT